jgi:hypothetical protein
MSDHWKDDGDLSNAINIFKVDGLDYRSTIDEILRAQSVKENPKQLEQLLTSYLHMFVNRLFMGAKSGADFIRISLEDL